VTSAEIHLRSMPAKVRMSEPKSSQVWIVFRAHWKQCCDVTQGAPSPVRATWTRVGSTFRANVSDASAFRHASPSPSSAAAIFHEFCEEATSSASSRGAFSPPRSFQLVCDFSTSEARAFRPSRRQRRAASSLARHAPMNSS